MSEVKYDGKYIQVVKEGNWEYVSRKGRKDAVIIVPILQENKHPFKKCLVLISEYRIPLKARELGFPAGLIGDIPGNEKEDVFAAARRECVEEIGYLPGLIKSLAENCPSSSGLTDEVFHILLAEDLKYVNDGGGDESEDIKIIKVSLNNIKNTIKDKYSDHIISPKIYMALYFLKELGYEIS